ncbi:MAG: cytochrome C [Acidobacteria bacterium]|nr:MAG: cytochrome C [Acidobacteriota bacterium]
MANQSNAIKIWLSPYVYLSANWISRLGVVLVTTGTVLWLLLLPVVLRGFTDNPYAGILTFMGLPAIFFGGLVLIPVGIVLRARRERQRGIYPSNFPPLDFENAELRKLLFFVGVTTVVNLIIGGQLVYAGVNYMDSVTFCGKTCHAVMQPQYVAYEHSPHARVPCVQCHIGPGASWFVRSKLSGSYQVFATIFSIYPRPIPVPVSNLRPARQTCEQCHWPARFEGNRLVVIPHYADDETNTLSKNVLLMHIGGGNSRGGIHGAHLGPGITIRYGSDQSRQKMNWVEYADAQTGKKTLFVSEKTDRGHLNPERGRVMDCIDCHNQPTHIFHLAGDAMDNAMANGAIPPSLPFVKKEGLDLLQAKYSSQSEAAQKISSGLVNYYAQNYPQIFSKHRTDVSMAVRGLVAIYQENVFPQMKVDWGTYPDNLGHMNFPGCFRCHGTLHEASDTRKMIPQDCSSCHNLLSMGEANPKILTDLGLGGGAEATH